MYGFTYAEYQLAYRYVRIMQQFHDAERAGEITPRTSYEMRKAAKIQFIQQYGALNNLAIHYANNSICAREYATALETVDLAWVTGVPSERRNTSRAVNHYWTNVVKPCHARERNRIYGDSKFRA